MKRKDYLQPRIKQKELYSDEMLMVSGWVDGKDELEDGGYGDGSDAAAKHYNIWEQEL